MSFGYSVTDIISLTTLSWKLYKTCKSAPASFASLSSEVLSLHAVLKEAEETLFPRKAGPGAPALSASAQENLRVIADGCHAVLMDLQSLIDRYEGLGRKPISWGRLKWGAEDIAELRSRLASNVAMLNTFVSISQIAVQQKLDRYLSKQKNSNRDSAISEQTADSLSSNEKLTWRSIRKELAEMGITVAAFDSNREFILNWFAEAVESGAFQPQNIDTDSSGGDSESEDEKPGIVLQPSTADSKILGRNVFKSKLRASSTFQSREERRVIRRLSTSSTDARPTSPSRLLSLSLQPKINLLTSVKARNISAVRKYLTADPEPSISTLNTALQTAIYLGDHPILHLLLTSHPNHVPVDTEIYINALLAASFDDQTSTLHHLLTAYPSHNQTFQSIFPLALKAAAVRGRTAIATTLLSHYYNNPNTPSPSQSGTDPLDPALRVAATQGHTEIVRQLLFHGANPNLERRFYFGNSLQAACYKGHREIVELLLQHKADPNAGNYQFGCPLQAASLQGHVEIVRSLIAYGADVNLKGGKYGCALEAARGRGHGEIVRILREEGAVGGAAGDGGGGNDGGVEFFGIEGGKEDEMVEEM
ncbi:hypothetical protein AJ79_00256 [Helicocarpus griseus UAMH5409]|uniref:Uncharacterized protein n=1 Tax=Helicocarpus griseus UAMH5409 TaxID=1447875 RepID=A0A2B7YCS9_9EURO|nr:hypothetical protein AJ79_00256 [Helicocarpus griseus UAMH5409]